MSKITFRADDDLVERVEALDASKSEVMREALRSYLDGAGDGNPVDEVVAGLVDAAVERRLDAAGEPRDVNVNVTVDADDRAARARANERPRTPEPDREPADQRTPADDREDCPRCGEPLAGDYVYCPNCGEKAVRRVFCECGDELRSDWAYCPGCGRRAPPADVLEG